MSPRLLLLGLLGLAVSSLPLAAQNPASPTVVDSTAAPRTLLKLGAAPSRLLYQSARYGVEWRASPSVGLERRLGNRFGLIGQAELDFLVARPRNTFTDERSPLLAGGALGLGVRYYYGQANRARHQRARGPFVGNYLALMGNVDWSRRRFITEVPYFGPWPINGSYTSELRSQYEPSLMLYWGLQRRLGRRFLFDFNLGTGVKYYAQGGNFGSPLRHQTWPNLDLGLRIYFVR